MENRSGNLGRYARDAASGIGLPRFWRWWMAELKPVVPAASRSALQRWRMRPVIEFGEREAVFWRPEIVNGEIELAAMAKAPLHGDPADVTAVGRAAMASIGADAQGHVAARPPRVVVALPPRQVMRKRMVLPAAVEENLEQALSYDLDRHTPFRAEQLYFDAVVVERDPARKTITVDWVAALKTIVDGARRQVEAWGASVQAVIPGPASTMPPRLNLIPADERPRTGSWRRWQVWAPLALLAAVAIAAVVVPLVQKREYAIALNRQAEEARGQAIAADAVRTQLERAQAEYNFVLAKKYAYPGTVQLLDGVTRVLPDDTWVTQLEMRTSLRGKDTQRDLVVRGESANAGKLIGLLEDSKLVEQAALRSSTTKIQPGPGEIFDLGAQVKKLPLPAPVPLTSIPDAAPPAPVPPPPAAAPPPAAPTAVAPSAPPPPGMRPAAPGIQAQTAGPARAPPGAPVIQPAPAPPGMAPGTTAATPGSPPPAPANDDEETE
ncbi:MAG TPA: PilN domain-containing protein [Acetobacteraceae bacterium]|nr:PilN domain-containing protein [Acetobacteraceae bacterium]